MCIHIYIYTHRYVHMTKPAYFIQQSSAGQRKRGAMGSKNPPLHIRSLVFSARHGSKNPGFVLRPLYPYAIASLGVS